MNVIVGSADLVVPAFQSAACAANVMVQFGGNAIIDPSLTLTRAEDEVQEDV